MDTWEFQLLGTDTQMLKYLYALALVKLKLF